MTEPKKPIRVMFVCMGNICRSPMAEAVFSHLVAEAGLASRFDIASAGTISWHVGERPHVGTQDILRKHGVPMDEEKRAMHVQRTHFDEYDYIVALDKQNMVDLQRYGNVPRLMEFAPDGSPLDVPDPYYEDNFEYVYQLVTAGCQGLLQHIREREGL